MVALIIMRRTKPDVPRTYRVPTFVPWLVLLISIFLVVTSFLAKPTLKYLFVLVFILIGCTLYHFYVANKRKSQFASLYSLSLSLFFTRHLFHSYYEFSCSEK